MIDVKYIETYLYLSFVYTLYILLKTEWLLESIPLVLESILFNNHSI